MAFTKAFYQDNSGTALTASFVEVDFGGARGDSVFICNDEASGANTVIWSFDGTTVHGVAKAGEKFELHKLHIRGLYLKYGTAAAAYRVIATMDAR